jgi:NAD(P)-dependent dehydrogenase (short-subunit alcohol dehydrogenase family)
MTSATTRAATPPVAIAGMPAPNCGDLLEMPATAFDRVLGVNLRGTFFFTQAVAKVPMGRWGYPEDVACAVAGLASGRFAFATGSIINADGGLAVPRL